MPARKLEVEGLVFKTYKIRLSVREVPTWVERLEYRLHPEHHEVRRWADRADRTGRRSSPDFRVLIYTRDDYWVEVRLPDGPLVAGAWLADLLRQGESSDSVAEACHSLSEVARMLRGGWRYPPSPLKAAVVRVGDAIRQAVRGARGLARRPDPFDDLTRPDIVKALAKEAARPRQ